MITYDEKKGCWVFSSNAQYDLGRSKDSDIFGTYLCSFGTIEVSEEESLKTWWNSNGTIATICAGIFVGIGGLWCKKFVF
jgi:hypothetical protein